MDKTNTKEITDAIAKLEEASAAVQAVLDDLQSAFDDRSEKWQEGEAGEAAQSVLETLQTVIDGIEEQAGELGGVLNS